MRGRHSSFEGDPKGGGARVAGHAGEVRSRRDAKRRARAQLNNACPILFFLLALFASLSPLPSVLIAVVVVVVVVAAVAITPL